eukprot:TRINITY_DN2678_c0_g1_i1.p2 TRINITY_DN2678_c0_g1~~TRINITY_DN2678_c0_g1_i1.p2  ORF type:complete len:115 (-),score=21.45 TRINITY_DN2678_c0_g1_i1:338-682(-)
MGLFFWRKESRTPNETPTETLPASSSSASVIRDSGAALASAASQRQQEPAGNTSTDENGAMEIPRATDVAIFEFGTADLFTLAGFCPISSSIQPCRWQVIPTSDPEAPQFRIAF